MGAKIALAGCTAFVDGSGGMHGAELVSRDLRGGAGLVVAALGAKGQSTVSGVHYIDRGYEDLPALFRALGARAERRTVED